MVRMSNWARKKKKQYMKKKKEIPVENTIYEFTPSPTGGNTIKGLGKTPRNLKKLFKDAVAIKKHLETRLNCQDSKFLLNSVVTVLRLVARFNRESRDMPFDWESKKLFPTHNWIESYWSLKVHSLNVTWSKAVEGNGTHIKTKNDVSVTKEVRMVEPIEDPNCVEENRTHIKTKNDVSVTKELGTVEPIEDPSFLTLCGLRRLVARATPSPLVDPLLVKGHAWIPPLLDPNKNCNETCDLPLNGEEKKIWQKFKEFDKGTSEVINFKFIEEGKRSIELDHPIVSLIGNFAVVAFNEACEMHVKKDEHNNLHDFEVMECKYMKIAKAYYFYMTIEAIEEGNLGVYETKVVCNNDGRRTLSKFLLTDRTPAGTKAMAISFFSCVRSICKSLDGIVTYKVDRMYAIRRYTKGRDGAFAEIERLSMLKDEILRGLRRVLSLDPPLLFPQECICTTNPDGWSHPDDNFSRMVRRAKGTPCRGYDYDNPFCLGRWTRLVKRTSFANVITRPP